MKSPKTKLMEKADALFSQYWKKKIGRCEVCGALEKQRPLFIHHIIGRECKKLRYVRENTMVVCWSCHQRLHQRGREVMTNEVYSKLKGDEIILYLRKARQVIKPVGIEFYEGIIKDLTKND